MSPRDLLPVVWRRCVVTALCGVLATHGAPVMAQGVTVPTGQVSAPSATSPLTDEALSRVIGLRLEDVSLKEALRTVAARAGLSISYSASALPASNRVSLVAERITVRDALGVLLRGTGMQLVALAPGRLVLEPAGNPESIVGSTPASQQAGATITGRVTDAVLHTPLAAVSVRIEGITLGTTADADGKYAIPGVASGTYRVARRVGYQSLSKDITVSADQSGTLDFALTAAATRLDEVVTTAVGRQRRYEVGNDISTINADSIAPTTPITSLTDLI